MPRVPEGATAGPEAERDAMATLFVEERDGWVRDAVAAMVAAWPAVERRTMFGCPCFMAGGQLFAVVSNEAVTVTRILEEERAGAPPGQPFFTGAGRAPLRKWHQVRVAAPEDVEALEPWLRRSHERALKAAGGT